jgi:hypothetical protein
VTISASADKVAAGYYVDQDIGPERAWQIYLNGYTFIDGAAGQVNYSAGYVQPAPGDGRRSIAAGACRRSAERAAGDRAVQPRATVCRSSWR